MFFAATMVNPRDRRSEIIDLQAHFLSIRRVFLSVFLVMLVLFTFDGPFFGTEPFFNTLRAAQMFLFLVTASGLLTESARVQLAISVAVLAGATAVAIIRFLPG